jgi:DNA-binding phage protein
MANSTYMTSIQTPPATMPGEVKQKGMLAHQTGRLAVVFEEDDLVDLLRAAVEREGGQTAFAKRYKVDRSRVNRILSRQLRSSEAIAKALGLRRAYIAD